MKVYLMEGSDGHRCWCGEAERDEKLDQGYEVLQEADAPETDE